MKTEEVLSNPWIYVPFNNVYLLAYLKDNTYHPFIYEDESIDFMPLDLARYLCALHNGNLQMKDSKEDISSMEQNSVQEEKDKWIQKAKALFFDLHFVDMDGLEGEVRTILKEAGGYDPMTESCRTELKWSKK